MNKNINIVIGLAVLAVVFGVGYLKQTEVTVNVPEQTPIVGAMSGPERTNPFESINGVRRHYFSSGFNQASTTLCSFQTPAATSTLAFGSAKVSTGTTTPIAIEIAKGTVPTATTTRLAYSLLGADAQGTVLASTSPTALNDSTDEAYVFAPSTYFTVKYGGAQGSLNTLVGSCKAEFVVN